MCACVSREVGIWHWWPSAIWVIVISLIWPPPLARLDNYVIMVPPVAVRYDIVTSVCAGVEFTTSSLAGSRSRPPRTHPGTLRSLVMSYKHRGLWCVHVDPRCKPAPLCTAGPGPHLIHFIADYKCSPTMRIMCFLFLMIDSNTRCVTYIDIVFVFYQCDI